MRLKCVRSGLALALLLATGAAVCAEEAAPAPSASPAKAAFVPADFKVPVSVQGPGFKLVPLGPALVKIDFEAYMSSIEHLQKTFSRSTRWPHKDISDADAMRDMEGEQASFTSRKSFAYAVLTLDGSRERGSVYVRPSPTKDYDAAISFWVTKAEYDAGFDAELYRWVTGWIEKEWPFAKVVYPGRSISWGEWDAILASSAATAASSQALN